MSDDRFINELMLEHTEEIEKLEAENRRLRAALEMSRQELRAVCRYFDGINREAIDSVVTAAERALRGEEQAHE